MEKNKVKVMICGTEYTLSAEDDKEYLAELGKELDAKMTELIKNNQRLSVTQCAVLSALEYLDAFKKADANAENLRSQIQDYLEDAARARTDSEITKREVERLGKELAALRSKSAN
ncbi:MAG: cell division protein ZapA [Clostridia bacterium]|nr:cell division protein ZapA [Clostridia bacterium]MBQ7054779.1 cell division protein ZapA [Oscillospiraceae bacterium]